MQYRKFGNTEMRVSEIGFGAWAIGGGAMIGTTAIGWGEADDTESIEAIHAALDCGINFFDTADIYGLGHSEKLLGRTIGKHKEVIIATKVGNVSRDGKFTIDYSKDYIIAACEASLKRLQRDTIDYYQLHSARLEHLQQGECIEAMQQLKADGKIRYWGLSLNTFQPEPEANYLLGHSWGNGFQLVLNMLNQRALALAREAAAHGYGIIARMPLQFGLLTGKFDKGASFAVNDHRKKRLPPEIIAEVADVLRPAWELLDKYRCTKLQLALSFITSFPEVATVIPGIRTAAQAKENTSGLFQLEAPDRLLLERCGLTDFADVLNRVQQLG